MENTEEKVEKKNKKNVFLLIILLLVVAITSAVVTYTYAKYISAGSGTGTVDIAKWAIKVNDTDITPTGTTTIGNIPLTTVNSQYVVNGKVAPQSSAYGTFNIDPTGSEVALGYKFALGEITVLTGICTGGILDGADTTEGLCTTGGGVWTNDAIPEGLAVAGVKYCSGATCVADESAGTWTEINAETSGADDGKYLGSILLPSATSAMTANEKVMVKVTVTWDDDEDAGATVQDDVDDVNHTAAGVDAGKITIPVSVTVYQKVA